MTMHSKSTPPETETLTPEAGLSNDIQSVEPFVGVAKNRPPMWGWLFAVICMVVPIMTVIDAGPMAHIVIGLIGAVACIFASFNALPAMLRVILCVVISAGTWFVFVSYHLKQLFDAVSQTY